MLEIWPKKKKKKKRKGLVLSINYANVLRTKGHEVFS